MNSELDKFSTRAYIKTGRNFIPKVRINTALLIRKAIKKEEHTRLCGLIFAKLKIPMDTFIFVYEAYNPYVRIPISRV